MTNRIPSLAESPSCVNSPATTSRRDALLRLTALGVVGGWSLRSNALAPPPAATSVSEAVSLSDYEVLAREQMSREAWGYVRGGAGEEITLRGNVEAFERLRLNPRVLVDVSRIDVSTELFGQRLDLPVLLAPTAFHGIVNEAGEVATALGASRARATMVVSTFANRTIADIAEVASPKPWYQLYVQVDRGFSADVVAQAVDAGCKVLFLTVDSGVSGSRNRQARAGFRHPPGVPTYPGGRLDLSLSWDDIGWVRSLSDLPLVIKGIIHPGDAARAADAGADGIVVSNHGGRSLDTLPPTIDALPRVADRIAGRIPILLDGGVRRGTDVIKAIALGAHAVMIGRPQLYGLAVGGADGVQAVVDILRRELVAAMALTGHTKISDIKRDLIW
ncbi:MAG: alpha-hydroxy acid oxidase [Pseudomonadota bacterium]